MSTDLTLISDNPVTNSKLTGPVFVDGSNVYVVGIDYADPTTVSTNLATANLHVFMSSDAGVTWTEQDAADAPAVYAAVSSVYGSPPLPGRVAIQTTVSPFVAGTHWIAASGVNDTLHVKITEFGYTIASVDLVVPDVDYGVSGASTIPSALAAALNTAATTVGINGLVVFSADLVAQNVVCSTVLTGSNWAVVLSGTMLDGNTYSSTPPTTGLNFGSTDPTFTITGAGANSGPVPIAFNTYAADWRSGVIYIAYVAADQSLGVAQFSTSSNTWLSPILGGPALTMIAYDPEYGANVALNLHASIKIRSTGDIVIAYSVGTTSGSYFYYTSWVVYSGGTWGTPALITNSYMNVPCGAVIDSLDNVAFFLNTGTVSTFIMSFIVLATGSTFGPDAIDPSPTAYSAIAISNYSQGLIGTWISGTDKVVVSIGHAQPSDSTYNHAYMLEIDASALMAGGGVWTIFRTPDYLDGIYQYGGGTGSIYWKTQNRTVFAQSDPPESGYLGVASGNKTDGSTDTSWNTSTPALTLANEIPYEVNLVVMPTTGLLGVLYQFYQFSLPAPEFYSRFAVFDLAALAITCGNPINGTVGVLYSHTFPTIGGTTPYTFSITAGSLPRGLTLDPVAGVAGGTPTTAGTYGLTIQAVDSATTPATVSVSCSITVNPRPFIGNVAC
jgi:hypothetical protein